MTVIRNAFLSCAALLAVPATAHAAPGSHAIVYKVFGEEGATSAEVRYKAGGPVTGVGQVRLPWSFATMVQAESSDALGDKVGLYVDRAQSSAASGGLYTCQIWVDGTLLEEVQRDLAEGSLDCFLGDAESDEVED